MEMKRTDVSQFDHEIYSLFRSAWRITRADPALRGFFWKAGLAQGRAARVRKGWHRNGVQVPPLLICSITTRCNLNCVGCYAHALARAFHRDEQQEMSKEKLESVLSEAHELGISIVLLAGGEPLVRKDLLEVTAHYPDIIFPLFTNGLLIDDDLIERFQRQKNVVPVISLEGYADDTDQRRGKGIYAHLKKIIGKMEGKGIFLGCSLTVNRDNFDIVLEDAFLQEMIASGCRLFFFVEYVPIQEGTESLLLEETQRLALRRMTQTMGQRFPGLFVSFPGDEVKYGGCLSSGRGFLHISAGGAVEPCPFAPYSDVNLQQMSLREALQSNFLRQIRENHDKLSEVDGGCALWANREWVRSLLPASAHAPADAPL
jgi:MoaA/NifB/PqqE/SkfB family radical SAM enzyme